MALKNYTTSISVEKTMMEIEGILAKNGATHIYKMYNNKGVPVALAFKAVVADQMIAFKLPMEEEKILVVFKNAVHKKELPSKYFNDMDQARRTGWRIIKDWISAQMALLEIRVAKFEEIFLPYMYDERQDKTLYQIMAEQKFKMPQLEYKGE
jgi:hypothetical protein